MPATGGEARQVSNGIDMGILSTMVPGWETVGVHYES